MQELSYTLLADGVTDRRLMPVLAWLLQQHLPDCAIQPAWADLERLPRPLPSLAHKIAWSVEFYPCHLLFVHQDAEREPSQNRVAEILQAVTAIPGGLSIPVVCVVPVRMQEAWLLFDEAALRRAADDPNGRQSVTLPRLNQLEQLPDPKGVLYELLREASGLRGQRRQKVRVTQLAYRVADLIDDFSPLRRLPAFQRLEAELLSTLRAQNWS